MRGKVFTLASVALLSCRAVIGIEDLEDPTDAGAGGKDAGSDSVRTDADTGPGPDTGATCSGQDCGKCCRDQAGPAYKEELEPTLKPCLCDGGCASSCGTNLCMNIDAKDTPCLPCMDDAIRNDSCPKEKATCGQSTTCKAVYDCLAKCSK